MQKIIEQELAALGGRSACIVIQLNENGPEGLVAINPNMVFPAASLAKLPILVEVARQVELGLLSWERRYPVPKSARVHGSGVVADLSTDLQPTLRDLAHLMIAISDNTAANMLLYLVGMEAVNSTMQQVGLTSTHLERRFMDFAARKAGRDNWTTPGDMALIFSYLCSELLPGRESMLNMLLRQNDNTILSGYWGEDIPFAHKTGGLEGVLHDAGILYPPLPSGIAHTPRTPLILVVMTADQADEPLTRYTLARIGRIFYNGYCQR